MTRCVACSRDQWLAELLACFLRRARVSLRDLPAGEAWLAREADRLRLLGYTADAAAQDAIMQCADPLIRAMLA